MRVKFFASLRLLTGTPQLEVPVEPGTPVRDVVEQVVARYPSLAGRLMDDQGALRDAVSIFANGRNVRLREGLDTLLQGDEDLALFPPVAGG